ncbi:MAG TPA: OmpA family protein [Rhizomicrobium sp.]|nr:OmpA family protein [Rhizomicrobium sp.]
MRQFIGLLGLTLALLCLAPAADAAGPTAQVRYVITNGGADVKDNGQVHFVVHGNHDGSVVAWAGSGEPAELPTGSYDVHVSFADGDAKKDFWIDNQAFTGTVDKKVEIGLPIADVRYVITNSGADIKDSGQVHFVVHGNHDGDVVSWNNSGGTSRIPAGTYDVHVSFSDGDAKKDFWIDNQTFAGKVEKTVEVGVNVVEVRYVITNGGADTKDKGQVHYVVHGDHNGSVVTWANSGGSVRIPTGAYDVHVTFSDGSARKDLWIDNQSFTGKVDRTVEVGVKLADVRYLIVVNGADTKDKGQVHYVVHGNHNGDVVDWANSGGTVRLAAGAYDAHVTYMDGMVHKDLWLDNQSFTGSVQRTVDLKIVFTQPVVSVTEDGIDVADRATIDYYDAANNGLGSARSSQPAQLEQGTYDIRAQMPGVEGWVRKMALSGKPHLTIALKKPVIATLTAGTPPPKACTIEVYGVNFDFNKSDLRPDSEPVLRQVLALFTGTPAFSAEVSGHTDNVGTPAYNMKLSDARAAAVKAWLVSQGVAAARVTSRGYGDTQPLVPNTTDQNRFKNRRVELRRKNCR